MMSLDFYNFNLFFYGFYTILSPFDLFFHRTNLFLIYMNLIMKLMKENLNIIIKRMLILVVNRTRMQVLLLKVHVRSVHNMLHMYTIAWICHLLQLKIIIYTKHIVSNERKNLIIMVLKKWNVK